MILHVGLRVLTLNRWKAITSWPKQEKGIERKIVERAQLRREEEERGAENATPVRIPCRYPGVFSGNNYQETSHATLLSAETDVFAQRLKVVRPDHRRAEPSRRGRRSREAVTRFRFSNDFFFPFLFQATRALGLSSARNDRRDFCSRSCLS